MIALNELAMRFGSKILFEGVSLQLNPGRRYGLVGANGSGKSTLLKILAGDVSSDKGDIAMSSGLKVGTMKQDHFLYENTPLLEVVLRGKPALWEAIAQKHHLLETHPEFDEETCLRLEALEQTIAHYDGYAAESYAAKLLEGLGLPTARHEQPMKLLSGGYKLRVLLAQLLFSDCDALLLDEPTNHLDLFTIRWLEEFLVTYRGTLVVVSHDRTFLNNVSTDILDVDYGTVKLYPGNYDNFMKMKAENQLQMEKQLLSHEKRKDQLMEFVERFGAKATKARQAKSKMHLVEKISEEMSELVSGPSSRQSPNVSFSVEKASGVRVLRVENLCKNYGENQVLDGVSLEIERGEKVAFLGANGIGKTTFLEVLVGNQQASSGKFEWGVNAGYTYFPQDPRKVVDPNQTALEWLCGVDRSVGEQKVRGFLGRVLIEGDEVHQPIKTLSGGETARLLLAKMMLLKTSVLIFDEPTNHLDMESIETLLEALNNYQGTVLLVSHNRYFVSSFADRIVEIQPQGVADYRCNYAEYIEKRDLDLLDREKPKQPVKQKETAPKQSYDQMRENRKNRTQIERKIAQLEQSCANCEAKMLELDKQLADPNFYVSTPVPEQQKLIAKKKALEEELEGLLGQWEVACSSLEESS